MKKPNTNNYYYKLLKKKYNTSEIVRSQIAEIKSKVKEIVIKEPLRSFFVDFKGQVVDNSFEKTLEIVSKRLFHKGKIDSFNTIKKRGIVEANITATQTEIDELIQYLMKRHLVLHCKGGISKDASNMLIIDEGEQKELNDFTPDHIDRNYVTTAKTCEKYTGRLSGYLIVNGLPLTTRTLGSELRFNQIVTKNKVFTNTGLKEIFLHLHFVTLILILDLEQHYFKFRIFKAQEDDLKRVEENIENLGLFTELFEHISSEENPLLFNNDLFFDLIKLERIVEKGSWESLPAYDSYIYSATKRLNDQFKFLEEYGLFLTYANCIEKFIEKLDKKISKHNSDFQNEHNNLNSNYHELKRLESFSIHPLLKNDYLEMMNSFRKLLAHVDSVSIQDNGSSSLEDVQEESGSSVKLSNGFVATIKDRVKALLSSETDSPKMPISHKKLTLSTEQEEGMLNLLSKVKEKIQKISRLETVSGKNAYLEARKNVPYLTNLSDALDQLKKLIKDIEHGKDMQYQFRNIFDRKNSFVILFNKLSKLVRFETEHEQKMVQEILNDLQKLLHDRPLKEDNYEDILDNINRLEDFVNTKKDSSPKKSDAILADLQKLLHDEPLNEDNYAKILDNVNSLKDFVISKKGSSLTEADTISPFAQEINQNKTFKTIINIKTGIQNIIEKEKQIRQVDTFKEDSEFLFYSEKELNSFLKELVEFHKKLKLTNYYDNKLNSKKIEKEFDKLIVEVNDIEDRISSRKRNKNNIIHKESRRYVDYLKSSQVARKNLEKPIILAQNQIAQALGFIKTIKGFIDQHSFVHSGVSTSVLFDQITYLLSNTDVRLFDMASLTEDMYNNSVSTIFRYQVGEKFTEPNKKGIENLMRRIEKKTIVKTYQNQK